MIPLFSYSIANILYTVFVAYGSVQLYNNNTIVMQIHQKLNLLLKLHVNFNYRAASYIHLQSKHA